MSKLEYDRDRAMKQEDFSPCIRCRKGVGHAGVLFYRVTIERMGINGRAVQRQAGLEMMLGGNAPIAHAMGEHADIGIPVGDAERGLLCAECAHDLKTSFMELLS